MGRKRDFIQEWGEVDVEWDTQLFENVDGVRKMVWCCPYYLKYRSMVHRCISKVEQVKTPNYIGCSVTPLWKKMSKFVEWVDKQPNKDWQNCDLDKDLLFKGNKIYSPETCVFLPSKVNKFMTNCKRSRGDHLVGAHWKKANNKFASQCQNPFTNKTEYLGLFKSEMGAHLAWKAKKHEHALKLAEDISDPRIKQALMTRYDENSDWTKD